MSNNPINEIITTGLSAEVAAAVSTLKAVLVANSTRSEAFAAAQSLSEAVEKFRALNA